MAFLPFPPTHPAQPPRAPLAHAHDGADRERSGDKGDSGRFGRRDALGETACGRPTHSGEARLCTTRHVYSYMTPTDSKTRKALHNPPDGHEHGPAGARRTHTGVTWHCQRSHGSESRGPASDSDWCDRPDERDQEPAQAEARGSSCASIRGRQHRRQREFALRCQERRVLGHPDPVEPRPCGRRLVDDEISADGVVSRQSCDAAASSQQQKAEPHRAPAACEMSAWAAEMRVRCSCTCTVQVRSDAGIRGNGRAAQPSVLGRWEGGLHLICALAQSVPVAV
jgi:hypothetical protein